MYSGKSRCIRTKVVVYVQSGFIRAKVVVFEKKWLYSDKVVVIRQKWMYSDKVVLFGQRWLYSKWFEPRSISSLCSVIVRVSVVLKRTVGDSD